MQSWENILRTIKTLNYDCERMEGQSNTFLDYLPKEPAKLKDRMSEWLEFAEMG